MKEILDIEDPLPLRSQTFSKLSFTTPFVILLIAASIHFIMSNPASEVQPYWPLIVLLFVVLIISCFASPLFALISFIRKEPDSTFKWIGAILNLFLFLSIAGGIIHLYFRFKNLS